MWLYGEEKNITRLHKISGKEKNKIFQAAFLTDTYVFKKTKETDCQLGALLS